MRKRMQAKGDLPVGWDKQDTRDEGPLYLNWHFGVVTTEKPSTNDHRFAESRLPGPLPGSVMYEAMMFLPENTFWQFLCLLVRYETPLTAMLLYNGRMVKLGMIKQVASDSLERDAPDEKLYVSPRECCDEFMDWRAQEYVSKFRLSKFDPDSGIEGHEGLCGAWGNFCNYCSWCCDYWYYSCAGQCCGNEVLCPALDYQGRIERLLMILPELPIGFLVYALVDTVEVCSDDLIDGVVGSNITTSRRHGGLPTFVDPSVSECGNFTHTHVPRAEDWWPHNEGASLFFWLNFWLLVYNRMFVAAVRKVLDWPLMNRVTIVKAQAQDEGTSYRGFLSSSICENPQRLVSPA